ncbi:hypothetical protein D3C76_133000 [compost metagenome]
MHGAVAHRSDDVAFNSSTVEGKAGYAFGDMVRILDLNHVGISTEDAGDFEAVPLCRDTRINLQTGKVSLNSED